MDVIAHFQENLFVQVKELIAKNCYHFFCLVLGLIVVNDPHINRANYTVTEWLLTSKPGLFGLVGGVANPTGIALIIILVIIFICSQTFVRRGGSFEVYAC